MGLIDERHKKIYDNFDDETKKKWDKLNSDDNMLLKIVRKTKPVLEGDVFVLSIIPGIYFYGKVLKLNANPKLEEDLILVVIFENRTREISMRDYKPDYNKTFNEFVITSDFLWKAGYFYTVGNIPLTEEERKLDIGFNNGVDLNYNEMDSNPKYLVSDEITTVFGVSLVVWNGVLQNPKLIEFTEEELASEVKRLEDTDDPKEKVGLDNIWWEFKNIKYESKESFLKALDEYNEDRVLDSESRISNPTIYLAYQQNGVYEEDIVLKENETFDKKYRMVIALLKADNGEYFTLGEILYKINNQVYNSPLGRHVIYEGIDLVGITKDKIPIYSMICAS